MIKKSVTKLSSTDILKNAKRVKQPTFIKPMLATLTKTYFSSNEWIYEHKFDGVRCIVIKKGNHVSLMSRNHRSINDEYPELVDAFEKQSATDFIVDGEIVAVNKKGISDFQMLQGRMNLKNPHRIAKDEKLVPVFIHIFDIMYTHGYDVTNVPLLGRKQLLKKLLRYNKLIKYTEHKTGDGVAYFHYACKKGWEGLIAKKSDGIYEERRSKTWLKFKCGQGQELVIGGYTEPRGSRSDFGALLVGYYDGDQFKYAGKVGTGYSEDVLHELGKKMRAIETKKCPFVNYNGKSTNVHWLRPKLVAEFQFAQWTEGGKLRVGRYKGLREDKKAKDVVKETPKNVIPSKIK